jgi:hypothetical protein
MWRGMHEIGVGERFVADRLHDFHELVQCLQALGFSRLDEHRALDDQGEIHGRGVEAIVHEPFGHIHRRDA